MSYNTVIVKAYALYYGTAYKIPRYTYQHCDRLHCSVVLIKQQDTVFWASFGTSTLIEGSLSTSIIMITYIKRPVQIKKEPFERLPHSLKDNKVHRQ